jgi:Flp pilus assembly protein TadB
VKALAALLVGLSVLCWCGPPVPASRLVRLSGRALRWRVRRSGQRDGRRQRSVDGLWADQGRDDPHAPVDRSRPRTMALVALTAGAATGFLVGGGGGFVLGAVVTLLVGRTLRRIPSRADRLRQERLLADLPLAADLLAACLRTGRPPESSIEAIAEGMGGPLGSELGTVAAALRLGCEPRAAWDTFLAEPVLAPFGRAMVRAWDSGAPLAVTLDRLATDARRSRRSRAEQKARAVGVRSAVPLGLCFLPAFVLVGVVPLVAGAVSGLLQ